MAARYFLALLPPESLQVQINQFKQVFADRYGSCKAFNAPPHITVFPPFIGGSDGMIPVQDFLLEFAHRYFPFKVCLNGFAAFAPRVIYIRVERSPALTAFQSQLHDALRDRLKVVHSNTAQREFNPHITVAFRDLTPENFRAGWAAFQGHPFFSEFEVQALTLLQHNGQYWHVFAHFPFTSVKPAPLD
jgi:2'-5' RNA ligase